MPSRVLIFGFHICSGPGSTPHEASWPPESWDGDEVALVQLQEFGVKKCNFLEAGYGLQIDPSEFSNRICP